MTTAMGDRNSTVKQVAKDDHESARQLNAESFPITTEGSKYWQNLKKSLSNGYF